MKSISRCLASLVLSSLTPVLSVAGAAASPQQPNVIVILTDDQGYGELGATGNPMVKTPQIDRFAKQSISLANYYVMPVCSPTRAGLMTGRYYYRTGIMDTYLGRSLMDPSETTVAHMLAGGGYRTGIFGKWHLGDTYPRRPMDKGFQESLVLNGGGLAQPGDPPDPVDERGAYFNATMRRNGSWIKTDGYVGDVVTDAAIQFVEANQAKPFFVYLAFNLPHAPHQVPDRYRAHFPASVFDPKNFPVQGNPMPANRNPDDLACVYGMIEDIDDNVGRLLARLDQLKLADNTIVILFSDNGCQHHNGFNAGLRGWKGSPYEGGIRQFCFLRWPEKFRPGKQVPQLTSHIDITPTILDLCGVAKPAGIKFDGKSLAPLLLRDDAPWSDRTLFAQWHRGDQPDRYRSFSVRTPDWKLVQPLGAEGEGEAGGGRWNGKTDFQLFNISKDPYEMHNVAEDNPGRVAELKAAYDAWFNDVTSTRDLSRPQRIVLASPEENPVLLTRQDWHARKAPGNARGVGYWDVTVSGATECDVEALFDPRNEASTARLEVMGSVVELPVKGGAGECVFRNVAVPAGDGRLEVTLQSGQGVRGIKYARVIRTN